MGRRGPTPKPANQRQAHPRTRQTRGKPAGVSLTVLPGGDVAAPSVPACPAGMLAQTEQRWGVYWASPVAAAVLDIDRPSIDRLFRYYDQWERMMREVTAEPFAVGSTGQLVSHPAAARVDRLEAHIGKLEAELGLTPLSRSRLGIAFGQAQLTADEVNRTQRPSDGAGEVVDADLLAEFEDAR